MFRYCISIIALLICTSLLGQNEPKEAKLDSVYKKRYGLRVGVDMARVVRTLLDEDYEGIELQTDYRIKKNLYIAGEIGTEEKFEDGDATKSTSSGNYIKAGVDLNVYSNWLNMDNLIYFGFRYGFAIHDQRLQEFNFAVRDFPFDVPVVQTDLETTGLNASWMEVQLGTKVEVFSNIYIGVNVQLKLLVSESKPDNFDNLFIPGFGRTYDTSQIGAGYNYYISYLIPIKKK